MTQIVEDAETPWTALKGVHAIKVSPLNGPITGAVMVPGSKSFSNRALIIAAMAEGATRLTGLLRSDDTYWCADALRRLGAGVDFENSTADMTGIGRRRPKSGALHVGSAGTLGRFLPTFLAAGEAGEWHITASQQLSKRPVGPLFDAIREGGGDVTSLELANCYPVRIKGSSFRGGKLTMAGNVSSQFISGILMGAVQAPEGLDLTVTGGIVQSDYVRITLDVMRHFGAQIEVSDDFTRFQVAPTGYTAKDLAVEADASTATYFAALAAVSRGDVTLANIGSDTRQPDYEFVGILERMGCVVERGATTTRIRNDKSLKGGFTIDMKPLSDATLTLAAIAPFADAPITMTGVAHIRHHECDRISAICAELTKAGIQVDEHEDGLTVYPGTPEFASLDTYEDHRVAMSLAVLGAAGAGVELNEPGCVSKTCPGFFDEIGQLGIATEIVSRNGASTRP